MLSQCYLLVQLAAKHAALWRCWALPALPRRPARPKPDHDEDNNLTDISDIQYLRDGPGYCWSVVCTDKEKC
ncbi:hypothetical protein B0H16DRAFT_1502782 [Mycena metata]|uniref:Uncharacterized protein n=1 Tax=Mycena metata TaxID=1033252 RepID=A0AAD7K6L1_9AGAR|nr:hypothetical protein B0H16DRAFT_1502782 [Mycena metata]